MGKENLFEQTGLESQGFDVGDQMKPHLTRDAEINRKKNKR